MYRHLREMGYVPRSNTALNFIRHKPATPSKTVTFWLLNCQPCETLKSYLQDQNNNYPGMELRKKGMTMNIKTVQVIKFVCILEST